VGICDENCSRRDEMLKRAFIMSMLFDDDDDDVVDGTSGGGQLLGVAFGHSDAAVMEVKSSTELVIDGFSSLFLD